MKLVVEHKIFFLDLNNIDFNCCSGIYFAVLIRMGVSKITARREGQLKKEHSVLFCFLLLDVVFYNYF